MRRQIEIRMLLLPASRGNKTKNERQAMRERKKRKEPGSFKYSTGGNLPERLKPVSEASKRLFNKAEPHLSDELG
jgi:hypothetical protein